MVSGVGALWRENALMAVDIFRLAAFLLPIL